MRNHLLSARRRWAAVGDVAVLGLLAGVGYGALSPPTLTSAALVVLASGHGAATQVEVARSNVVLASALPRVAPAMSLPTLRSRVQVTSVTDNLLSISAHGPTAAQAENTANAVAKSYVRYVGTPTTPAGTFLHALILQSAFTATGAPLWHRLLVTGGLGALLGLLIGAIGVIALSRDRRFLAGSQ